MLMHEKTCVIPINTSGLSILLHGVISLPDATSYDKFEFVHAIKSVEALEWPFEQCRYDLKLFIIILTNSERLIKIDAYFAIARR